MKEIRDIISAYDLARVNGQDAVLATVVHTEGSSYRGPGARMLITDDGQLTGTISGGCLEGDALRKALLVMKEQRTTLVTYDTNDEDDAVLGMGLGCNGIIQVLIEPINPDKPGNPIELLRDITREREPAVLVTLFSLADKKNPQPGTVLLYKQQHSIHSENSWFNIVSSDARIALEKSNSFFKHFDDGPLSITAFIEFIPPPVSLIIIGAGNDVMPLVRMADILGWETTIADGRANYAKSGRFPSCNVIVSKPANVLENVKIDNRTVFTLMTHNYNYDLAILKELLTRNVTYIGMLGPRKRRDRMLNELHEQGVVISEEQLSVLHAPVGLDIGAETSEEIALSIVAEISAVLAGKTGKHLKDEGESIHVRPAVNVNLPLE